MMNLLPLSKKIDLNTPRAYRNALIFIPIVFGLWSLLLGADSNWDSRNYHLYNAFALLNDRLQLDFAPGGFQNYFNPIIEVPYYLGMMHLPPRLLGFLMGFVHGLNYVLLLGICRKVLPQLPQEDQYRVPVLLALAGCLTLNFLSELGSTMGDNMTSLCCLASILTILHTEPRIRSRITASSLWTLLAAGLMMGMGAGLKLTNAPYAVALCIGLLTFSIAPVNRITLAFVFGIGVLIGLGATNGYWFYKMWQTFRNPLFPQFSNIFPNALAPAIGVADTIWQPQGLWEQLLWPFIISADAQRATQIDVRQIIWGIVYALFILLALKAALQLRNKTAKPLSQAARYIMVVVALGFIIWMKLFGIYRYLVPVELLTPLVIFVAFSHLLPYSKARSAATWTIAGATLVVLLGGLKTWGHQSWTEQPYHVDVPTLSDPSRTTVLITDGDPPWSWLAMAFPAKVAFTQIEGNFPKGSAFIPHIQDMVARRGGPTFALFRGHYDFDYDAVNERADKITRIANTLGLTGNPSRCAALSWIAEKTKLRVTVSMTTNNRADAACTLEIKRPEERRDLTLENRAEQVTTQTRLRAYGFTIVPEACTMHRAGIGDAMQIFQWCPITTTTASMNSQD
jgi:hypothetical protein